MALLAGIRHPRDLDRLSLDQLDTLAGEIRAVLVESVALNRPVPDAAGERRTA